MADRDISPSEQRVLDLRRLPRPQGHRNVLTAYGALNVGESLVVVSDHDPAALQDEVERELAGAFSWETLALDDESFRARITKRASTALPRVVADTTSLFDSSSPDAAGSIWQLEPGARDLDSNIIALPPYGEIAQHAGPDLDVLIFVLAGSGELHTELTTISLEPGALLWLPRKAQRRFTAGPDGLRYLTVHQRKPTLNITPAPGR